ncbi:MAG TPA: UDP-glucose 6-dehydrogenase [Holosporales bacterium]|nr:UDP-glucose 6-dehydrogenase [Holosporales bacterium]
MKITLIGTGYVGLVSGACFSELGFNVSCVDIDQSKIDKIKQGIMPIYEQDLDTLVINNMKAGRLTCTTSLKEGMDQADVVMIAVGTPCRKSDGHADLTYVYEAAKQIAQNIHRYTVVVTKSTVPVGTAQEIIDIIQKERPDLVLGKDFDVASNPEFLREGSAISDFMQPDRIVIGTTSKKSEDVLKILYKPLTDKGYTLYATTVSSSEMIKYAANAFLAIKISFINQIADLCEAVGANVDDVARGIGSDKRIGFPFLKAGPGYGGSCFPKDTRALVQTAELNNQDLSIVRSAAKANEDRKIHLAERIIQYVEKKTLSKPFKLAVLGVAFKAGTDDIRDASSLVIIPKLVKAGIKITVYDPLYFKGSGREHLAKELNGVTWAASTEDALSHANGFCILTEWPEFSKLNLHDVKSLMLEQPMLADFRNLYNVALASDFDYLSLGRRDVLRT